MNERKTNMTKYNPRKNYAGKHILAEGYSTDTDTWVSGINNNVLVFGPSGAGKTRNYVKPNILNSHESMIISDTKGSLYGELHEALEEKGFIVKNINFTDPSSGSGYNPMSYIRYDETKDRYNEQDIITLSECLIAQDQGKEPYWCYAARQYLSCLIGYVLETKPASMHTLKHVMKMFLKLDDDCFPALIDELELFHPESTIPDRFRAFRCIARAEKMDASIRGIISTNLDTLCFDDALAMYEKPDQIDFRSLGRKKTAVFLTVSDTDRSMDKLANAFITQALQILCRSADHDYKYHRLPVPVRFYLDDFATNVCIPDFDKIISVIRSREISVSVILQSISQLYSLYGDARAKTIINNCDSQMYLGSQDIDTVEYISKRANRPFESVMAMPLDDVYLFIRGHRPVYTKKYTAPCPDEVTKNEHTAFIPSPSM